MTFGDVDVPVFGSVAEVAERARLFRAPLGESGRRLKGLPRGAWGMTLAHLGLGLFVMGAVVETAFKVEDAAVVSPGGPPVAIGPWRVTLGDVSVIEGPNYLAERGAFTIAPAEGGAERREITAERRFFPAGGQTTTEVGLDFRGLDDVYVVLGERRGSPEGPAWSVRAYWNPWARLIFVGPAIMALGGLVSLSDRRLRVGAPQGRAKG